MARLMWRRLARLEHCAEAARYVRLVIGLAREQHRNPSELLASAQEQAAWFRWDQARHPPPAYPDGRIDIEPSIRRWAAWAGIDPDEAVQEFAACIDAFERGEPKKDGPCG